MSDSGSNRAVRGASLLILLQVGSRALTFTANQVLLRFMTAELLGVSAQLEVYYLSVLFFARESLRVAIQRQGHRLEDNRALRDSRSSDMKTQMNPATNTKSTSTTTTIQAAVNISYIAIILGAIVAAVLGQVYVSSVSTSSISSIPNLRPSFYLYAFAAMVELLSEPAFVIMQIRLQFGVRATAEAVATFLRCVVTLGSAVWASRSGLQIGVLPFALGQATYGLALLGVYVRYGLALSHQEKFSLLPVRLADTGTLANRPDGYVMSYFYRPTLQLASSMMAQSLVKHVLTQGDTFLVSILSTTTAQGVYALANNYGGLIARLVLQPVEESSRSYFSRLLSPSSAEKKDQKPGKSNIREASTGFQALLRLYVLMSLIVISIGPTAAPLLLSLVAGPRWATSGAGACLSAFAWYIPLLAINGVAEAFVASVASEAQVHMQSAWMTAFSLVFAAAGVVFLRVLDMGAVGLVVANGVNMICRITWCAVFITHYFREHGVPFEVGGILPGPLAVLAGVVTSQAVRKVVARVAEDSDSSVQIVTQLAKIAAVTVPFLTSVALSERSFIFQGYQAIRGKPA